MTELKVTVDGKQITIKAGDSIETVKGHFGDDAENIFDGVDTNENGTIDTGEFDKLKDNLTAKNYTVEVSQDGKSSKRAYNQTIRNMADRYNKEMLGGYFESGEEEKYEIKSGDTLWKIAKTTLEAEGLTADNRAINNRIAQIANLNDIEDVNDIRVGTQLVYKLTAAAVEAVKAKDGDSAAAFGYTALRRTAGGGAADVHTQAEVEKSDIEVTENFSCEGKDGYTKEELFEKLKAGETEYTAAKYSKEGEADVYEVQIDNIYLHASSEEELKTKFDSYVKEITQAPEEETEEVAKTRKEANLEVIKGKLEASDYNIEVIKEIAGDLQNNGDLFDMTSDDYKSLIRDLFRTKNADVISALLKDGSSVDMSVVENDKEGHELLARLYQEIRAKERRGERLSDEEIALKDILQKVQPTNGYKIEADTEKGIHEKYMSYGKKDGNIRYGAEINGRTWYTTTPELLDEFLTKLEAAEAQEGEEKTAALKQLFSDYSNTTDTELAKYLANNHKYLEVEDSALIEFVKTRDMEVLQQLETDDTTYSTEVIKAVVDRIKEIYTTEDKGNLENARYLGIVSKWINKTVDSSLEGDAKTQAEADAKALKLEIMKTYLVEIPAEEEGGSPTYKFNPERIPTYEEMLGLSYMAGPIDDNTIKQALVKYITIDNMGKGRAGNVVESYYWSDDYMYSHYADLIDGIMNDETKTDEEKKAAVIDFIENKIVYQNYHLPFDKIMEHYGEDVGIKKLLFKYVADSDKSRITDDNRLALVKDYIKDDGTFDTEKYKQAANNKDFKEDALYNRILKVLPYDCSSGDAQKYFNAIFKELSLADSLLYAYEGHYKNVQNNNTVKNKVRSVLQDTSKAGTAGWNELVKEALGDEILDDDTMGTVYENGNLEIQKMCISAGYTRNDELVIVQEGTCLDKIIKDYLKEHLDKFPQLQKSVNNDTDRSKWTDARIDEALNYYVKDFRADIAKDLGITDPNKIKAGDIIDLGNVKWDDHQPNWWRYNFAY